MKTLIAAYLKYSQHYLSDCEIIQVEHVIKYDDSIFEVKVKNERLHLGFEVIDVYNSDVLVFLFNKLNDSSLTGGAV